MSQAESSDYYFKWVYDSTPGFLIEPPDRIIGIPKFLTAPQYSTQGNYIRWRIAGMRPLKFEVSKDGYEIFRFTYGLPARVLFLKCKSGFKSGAYEIRVSNIIGTAIRRLKI